MVDAFQRIGGTQPIVVGGGQREDCESLGQVFFQPGGEFGGALGIVSDDFLEPLFGGGATGAFEDAANGPGDFSPLIQARDISLGVLLEMKLAALPRDGPEDGLARGRHAGGDRR